MAGSERRGRIPNSQRARRQREVLEAALAEVVDSGAAALTMDRVARRAGASKETLYSWFGSRDELIGAIIEANADSSAERVAEALTKPAESLDEAKFALVGYCTGLLELLTSPVSVQLNRAAMAAPALASRLLTSGRYRVGPVVEEYLSRLSVAGLLAIPDPSEAFRTLYGLAVRDTQIVVLLGGNAPSSKEIRKTAGTAVDSFFRLYGAADR